MTATATLLPRTPGPDLSPTTLANLASCAPPAPTTHVDDLLTMWQTALDWITNELAELDADMSMAQRMKNATAWQREITADRHVLRTIAQHLRQRITQHTMPAIATALKPAS